jgi:hypothetical protein
LFINALLAESALVAMRTQGFSLEAMRTQGFSEDINETT